MNMSINEYDFQISNLISNFILTYRVKSLIFLKETSKFEKV